MIHQLKTINPFYRDIVQGKKRFEVRKNDRGFKVGDILRLREYDPKKDQYTGFSIMFRVGYILEGGAFGLEEGFCIMQLESGTAEMKP